MAIVALALVVVLSLAIGSRQISLPELFAGLWAGEGPDRAVLLDLRLPRTLLGILAGAGLAVAGVVMQATTRNPLADPGLLGVNAGAVFAVVAGIALFGQTGIQSQIWLALLGAGVASAAVYAVGSVGGTRATPLRLTLGGVALGAVLGGAARTIMLLDPSGFDFARHWMTGAIAVVGYEVPLSIAPFAAAGFVVALAVSRSLDALALGDDLARSLGLRLATTRVLSIASIALLAGSATAAVGPVGFVGLIVSHIARQIAGSSQRRILAFAALLGPTLVLLADIVGRVVAWPEELPASIVTAVVGGPVLILLARRLAAQGQ
ncbi:FecCD family ABC transporter permease [Amorphus sp. 3PC139-8]|uniref:FecCD family ABC transporter permease n=1 Tax=Amorphus sp. 3PC139-8 TaxID=2735676 RepID=UPI00345C7771